MGEIRITLASLRDTSIGMCFVGIVLLAVTTAAWAGPPLVSDDPGTVGKGMLEAIVATAGVAEGNTNLYSSPILDLTYGVTDRLDLDFVFEPIQLQEEEQTMFDAMPVTAGFKWQFLSTSSFSTSFAPAFTYDTRNASEAMLSLPIQLEYASGRWRFGTDLMYSAIRSLTDVWQAGIYGGWSALDKVELLSEVWGVSLDKFSLTQTGWSLGVDAAPREDLHLLVGGGAGIHSDRGDPLDWRGYVGIQLVLPGPPT